MNTPPPDLAVTSPCNVSFEDFELNLSTRELRKHGIKLKLAEQPFRILTALLSQPGELVTRDELRLRLWPEETAGDFEQGLNRAVSKLRDTLNDRAASPRLIETLPGRGYRFIGVIQVPKSETLASPPPFWRRAPMIAAMALVLLAAAGLFAHFAVWAGVPQAKWRKLTNDNYTKFAPTLSDGTRIYFAASYNGEQFIAQVPATGGQPTRLPVTPPGPSFVLHDLSPDGQELLLGAAPRMNWDRLFPLWTLKVADGSARRLGSSLATSAAYSPVQEDLIAYSTTTEIWVAHRDGGQPRRLIELKDSLIDGVCWSPDGSRIRFTRHNPLTRHGVPWDIQADGRGLKKAVPGWGRDTLTSAGWMVGSHLALFGSEGMLWGRQESWFRPDELPQPLTGEGLDFDPQFRVRSNDSFHTMGADRLGELQHFQPASGTWSSLLEGLSVESVDYSPDRRRLTYVTYPQRALWVRQIDGTRPIQLTSQPLEVSFPQWSPDGRQIVFSAGEGSERPARLYVIDAEGGTPRLVVPGAKGPERYPTWSPDGQSILYDALNRSEEIYIRVANLKTGAVSKLPGSDGLLSPRRSPNGEIIAALRFAEPHSLMLFHVKENRWESVGGPQLSWPNWTSDSKALYARTDDLVVRYRLDAKAFEKVTAFKREEWGGFAHWLGVGLDNWPMRTLNRDSRQVYAIHF